MKVYIVFVMGFNTTEILVVYSDPDAAIECCRESAGRDNISRKTVLHTSTLQGAQK